MSVPAFVLNWQPVPMGTILRRPTFSLPEPEVFESFAAQIADETNGVRRTPCRCGAECRHGGRCGSPLIKIPAREYGRASATMLYRASEVWTEHMVEHARVA